MMQLNTSNQPTQEMSFAEIHSADDAGCGFEITDDFKRFNACNDVFARAQWDPRIRSSKSMSWFYSMLGFGMKIKKADGYTQKDFALRNAGWVMANLMMERTASQNRHDGFLDDYKAYKKPSTDKVAVEDRRQMSAEIKKAGLMFGADMIGITGTDLRWHYTHRFDAQHLAEKPYTLPEGLDNCIVIGTSMQYEIMKTYPSAWRAPPSDWGIQKTHLYCIP
jgi:epoxyqueuosine reductase